MSYNVRFIDEGVNISVQAGVTLLQARIDAGLSTDAPCGGRGTCGKCAAEWRYAGSDSWTRCLACQTPVDGDVEARMLRGSETLRVLTGGANDARRAWNPMVKAAKIAVPPCPRGDSASDWTRLCGALDRAFGPKAWQPEIRLCRELGRLLAETRGTVWAVVRGDRVLDVRRDEPQVRMVAFDLGTTTIAGYLIDAATGRVTAQVGARNPQAQYGGDVISRADYAMNYGPEALADCARTAIDSMIGAMCAQEGVARAQVYAVLLAGNTAMHHLFLGILPDSLAKAPYNPTISQPLELEAAAYGLRAHPLARLCLLPVVGGFVGADTVACLISGDWLNRERLTLMIDIGTNGELVMGNRRRRVACSTAAGPALEGAKISCGMRGAEGAIDHVWLEEGSLKWHVIGEGAPKGVCGSGLVDLIAALLETGEIDGTGRMEGDAVSIGHTGLRLTQKDVREVQLAKAAIAAGIRLLAKRLGIGLEDIEEVDIAGAFGNYIDPDSACAIGLIPLELRQKIVPVGNAAGEGAKLALGDEAVWQTSEALARETEFLELATVAEFQDEFVDQLSFEEEND